MTEEDVAATNGILKQWISDASHEVQTLGWKDVPLNALMLFCHGAEQKMSARILKELRGPIKWFVGAVWGGLVWVIVRTVLDL